MLSQTPRVCEKLSQTKTSVNASDHTRAVLGYVQSVAAALPEVGRSLWAMGR